MFHKSKSFTLVEVIVVMGVLGLILGGLLASLRQIIDSETMLKKMQVVEEETRFIMDAVSQDSEYSEISSNYKPCQGVEPCEDEGDIFAYTINYLLAEKRGDIGSGSSLESEYSSYTQNGTDYFLRRTLSHTAGQPSSATLNTTPLMSRPVFRVRRIVNSEEGAVNYFVTASLVFKVEHKGQNIYVPVETSAMSRTFEF